MGGEYIDTYAFTMRDMLVVRRYDPANGDPHWMSMGGTHKNVCVFYELENGDLVAWNENTSRGWSFPVLSKRHRKI